VRSTIVLFVLFLTVVTTVLADTWHIETVDSAGEVGWDTSIALDSADNPHISYYDWDNQNLKYAYWDGSSWDITTVDSGNDVGRWTSIALDSGDNPHISYCDETGYPDDYLKYAFWDITTVDASGWNTSIALDSEGKPRISYYGSSGQNLRYARWDDSTWYSSTVDNVGNVGECSSIAMDSGDKPHISYLDATNYDLKYAVLGPEHWTTMSVHTTGNVGFWTSIALDSNDYPHISYLDTGNSDLKYAYWDGSSWNINTVNSVGSVGYYTSIALDSGDNPHISYEDWGNHDLKYARWTGSTWDITVVDSDGWVGDLTSIALDSDDNPHISYFDRTNGNLKYAHYGPEDIGIILEDFTAKAVREAIILNWSVETAEGGQIAGFNLYRSKTASEGKAIASREKLNAELITGESPYKYLDTTVEEGSTYNYRLEALDVSGATETFGPVTCTAGSSVPTAYALRQSRPNPARGSATIAFDLPEDAEVTLTVYDVSGRKVTTVVNETLPAGEHEAEVPGLAPGVYVYKLEAGEFNAARKMVIVE
jgi:hypothetical protein